MEREANNQVAALLNPRPRGRHKTEPPMAAYEGSISTRTPKSQGQGITPRSSKARGRPHYAKSW